MITATILAHSFVNISHLRDYIARLKASRSFEKSLALFRIAPAVPSKRASRSFEKSLALLRKEPRALSNRGPRSLRKEEGEPFRRAAAYRRGKQNARAHAEKCPENHVFFACAARGGLCRQQTVSGRRTRGPAREWWQRR